MKFLEILFSIAVGRRVRQGMRALDRRLRQPGVGSRHLQDRQVRTVVTGLQHDSRSRLPANLLSIRELMLRLENIHLELISSQQSRRQENGTQKFI